MPFYPKIILRFSFFIALFVYQTANAQKTATVATDGSAQFSSIQKAIDSFADDDSTKTVFIKSGIYDEQIFISKNGLSLVGEVAPIFAKTWVELKTEGLLEKTGVVICFPIYREIFRCEHPDDWGAAVVNIRANDVSLKNLTIANTFGFDLRAEYSIFCKEKSIEVKKDGHQFALRAMPPTQRLQVERCNFYSLGGDTVSPWDVENGTYIFSDCTMEGAVDFYCPRGWAFAECIHFICHNPNAAIWHDGSADSTAVSVIQYSDFVGDVGFKLGRFHRDAQIFLLDCHFSEEMADAEIYQVPTNNTVNWGKRVFYNNCSREGGAFNWFLDNFDEKMLENLTKEKVLQPRWDRPQVYQNKVNHNILPKHK